MAVSSVGSPNFSFSLKRHNDVDVTEVKGTLARSGSGERESLYLKATNVGCGPVSPHHHGPSFERL